MSEAYRKKHENRQSADWLVDADGKPIGLIGPEGKVYQPVIAETGPGGGIKYPVTRNPGGGSIPLSEMLPRHSVALNPALIDTATITAAAGVVVSKSAAASGEWSSDDLVFTMAAATAAGYSTVPLPVDALGAKARLGYHIHFRVWCSDWSGVSVLGIWPYVGATTNSAGFALVGTGSPFGCVDPAFAPRWNENYRTFNFHAPHRANQIGTMPAWGTGGSAGEMIELDGFRVQIGTNKAVTIKINRVYSSKWPVGAFTLIGDGGYNAFRAAVLPEFARRDWRGAVSLFKLQEDGAALPDYAALSEFADLGWDVYPHMRALSPGVDVPFNGTESIETIAGSWDALKNRIINNTPAGAQGLRLAQFLQNSGRSNVSGGVTMAQVLARRGASFGRYFCTDSEFGINPFAGGAIFNLSRMFPLLPDGVTRSSSTAGNTTGWVPPWGQFNHFAGEMFAVNEATQGASTPLLRDTYTGSLLEMAVDRAARYSTATWQFTHEIVPREGAQPTIYNSGTEQFRDLMDDLDHRVGQGRLLVLSPSEHYAITYGRSGDVFVRWDGEWVYRHDPTKIAF